MLAHGKVLVVKRCLLFHDQWHMQQMLYIYSKLKLAFRVYSQMINVQGSYAKLYQKYKQNYLITQKNHTLEMMYKNAVSEYKHQSDWSKNIKKEPDNNSDMISLECLKFTD